MNKRKIIAGNWKMNLLMQEAVRLSSEVESYVAAAVKDAVTTILCPSAVQLAALASRKASWIHFGAQDCHIEANGAYTGDISAEMLKDAGAAYVIVGHSERRAMHKERSEQVAQKALAAKRAGLIPIICIGETLQERQANQVQAVLKEQIAHSIPAHFGGLDCVVAYEPVWAIGTGQVATLEQIAETHCLIAEKLPADTPILYGGSVNEQNAFDILSQPHVQGVLVGGASLQAARFNAIIAAALAAKPS